MAAGAGAPMIAFLEHETACDARLALGALRRRAAALGPDPPAAAWRDLLVDYGEWEAAMLDARWPDRDDQDALAEQAGAVALDLARAAAGRPVPPGRVVAAMSGLEAAPVPAVIRLRAAEGYAQYGVYPDLYVAAAGRLAAESRASRAVCIGIRSIGTSLSAAVAAGLEIEGMKVERVTVRPHGHPFERRLRLEPRLSSWLASRAQAQFAVVDEGPGLSGSSFAAVAAALGEHGVPDDHIALLPSWNADGSGFASEGARAQWRRHRRYAAAFEDVFVGTGRLGALLQARHLTDISAGRWRRLFFGRGPGPALHPAHERRKYLFAGDAAHRRHVARFAGLGRHGAAREQRACRLAEGGWGPAPIALRDGFLVLPFVEGRPLTSPPPGPVLIDTIARYLAFVRRAFPAPQATPVEALVQLVEVNAAEAGIAASGPLFRRLSAAAATDEPPVAVDGRMLVHEWLRTSHGFCKTDAIDHHADHFFPGGTDPAWDVAAAAVELGWNPAAERALIGACARHASDFALPRRLPFFVAAYLAFRLGYCTLAGPSMAGPAAHYRARLAGALEGRAAASVDRRRARTVP